jgi:hypothetical protein
MKLGAVVCIAFHNLILQSSSVVGVNQESLDFAIPQTLCPVGLAAHRVNLIFKLLKDLYLPRGWLAPE